MSAPLAIVISYCSNEREYIDRIIIAALNITPHVIVSVGKLLYDGSLENICAIQETCRKYPGVHLVLYGVLDEHLQTPHKLHNLARITAVEKAKQGIDGDFWVLMLDGDEIPRCGGRLFKEWWALNSHALDVANVFKFLSYWYFLRPNIISTGLQDNMLLAHSSHLHTMHVDQKQERDDVIAAVIASSGGESHKMVAGLKREIMFDHFAWVRPDGRDGLLKKIKNWGLHSSYKPWHSLIGEAFDNFEKGVNPTTDFVHGWPLAIVSAVDSEGFTQPDHSSTARISNSF